MTGKASGRDEYGVTPQRKACRPGVPREPTHAARAICRHFIALIEMAAISRSARALTSIKAIEPSSYIRSWRPHAPYLERAASQAAIAAERVVASVVDERSAIGGHSALGED